MPTSKLAPEGPAPERAAPACAGEAARLLPIVLDLRGQLCVVVGAGRVGSRKARTLRGHGARVRLIVPEAGDVPSDLEVGTGGVQVLRGACDPPALAGARLVIAATNDPSTNRLVAELARRLGILVLRVDAPEESDFQLPAVLRAGDLSVAFSTQGASPGLAVRLRDEARAVYGAAHAEFCRLARWLRAEARLSLPSDGRERLLARWVHSEALDLLVRGEHDAAAALARQLLDEARAEALRGG